jgi:hypothetical protein
VSLAKLFTMKFTKDRSVGLESADTLIMQLLSSLSAEFLVLASLFKFRRWHRNGLVLSQDVLDSSRAIRFVNQVKVHHCGINDDSRFDVDHQWFTVRMSEHVVGDPYWR